jgi:hypothetical protein
MCARTLTTLNMHNTLNTFSLSLRSLSLSLSLPKQIGTVHNRRLGELLRWTIADAVRAVNADGSVSTQLATPLFVDSGPGARDIGVVGVEFFVCCCCVVGRDR